MVNTAIKFENISKQYRLGLVSTRTLSHDLNRWWQTSVLRKEDPYLKIGEANDRTQKGENEYVWALKDISFDVKQGDVLGIIGKNGAGKSTLLKILSRVTTPSTGTIKAKGRIASLLEVGTGFHPELTGRENIYMNGSIMGMSRYEINRKLDEIIEFAGVARYIDTPAKRYSSGMTVRLGFSIAAHLEPEILVVDEVLAVGDAEFQKKAIGKMQDVSKGDGRTVLFVSHNMGIIMSLCKSTLLLQNGFIKNIGETNQIINEYMTLGDTSKGISIDDTEAKPLQKLKIRTVRILNHEGAVKAEINNSNKAFVEITYDVLIKGRGYNVGFELFNSQNGSLFCTALKDQEPSRNDAMVFEPGSYKAIIELPLSFLRDGEYWIVASAAIPNIEILDTFKYETHFSIIDVISPATITGEYRPGIFLPVLHWNLTHNDEKIY